MADQIQGSGGSIGPISPHDKQIYTQEYKHGAQLFQKALQQYAKSNNPAQQEEFQSVMDKALHVLNETARALNQKALLDQNAKIQQDYQIFNQNPTDAKAIGQLDQDLTNAKKSVS